MQLDVQALLNIIGALVVGAGGWFGREIWDAVQALKRDIHALEVELPKSYVRKDEFAAGITEIKHMLLRIEEKLDAKADK